MEEHKTWKDFEAKYEIQSELRKNNPNAKKLVWKVKNKENNENYVAKSYRFNTQKDLETFLLSTQDIMRAKHDNLVDTFEFYVDVTESSNNFRVIFIQEYLEKNVHNLIKTEENTENSSYLSSGDTRKLLHQSLNLMEYIQRNKLFFKAFNKEKFFMTEYENFKISGLVETYVYLVDLKKFPFSIGANKSANQQKDNVDRENDITELDHIFEDLIIENPYKDDALDLCICLIDILTLGKSKSSDLYNEGRRRALIDKVRLNTKIDLVNVLHFMSSDSSNLRSDFVNLKKMMMNATNKRSKEFKFERIFAEEGMNHEENQPSSNNDIKVNPEKEEPNEVNEYEKYLDTKIQHNKGKCVKEYTITEEKNGYYRFSMEDYSLAIDGIFGDETGLFGVFDGHRGDESVKFVVNFLPEEFKKLYQTSHENMEQLLSQLFANTDKNLFEISDPQKESGTTACICFIENLQGKKSVYVANIGDTRAVLFTPKGAERLSFDHVGSDPSEEARVRENGGAIIRNRLSAKLAVTRAFGDFELKKEGLICEPFVKKVEIESEGIVIIASDGFWNTTTDEETESILSSEKELTTREISSKLIQLAVKRGSKDNITVLTIKL